jgi:hypothetical protein
MPLSEVIRQTHCSIASLAGHLLNPPAKPLRHALEQLQEILVCVIVGKELTAIDSAIEYVVPTVLYGNAQGTTPSGRLSASPALRVKFNVDC